MDPETLGCLAAFLRAPIAVAAFLLAGLAFVAVQAALPDAPPAVAVPLGALAMLPPVVAGLALQARASAWLARRAAPRVEAPEPAEPGHPGPG
jgi:hypothetical protein